MGLTDPGLLFGLIVGLGGLSFGLLLNSFSVCDVVLVSGWLKPSSCKRIDSSDDVSTGNSGYEPSGLDCTFLK